jgi:hypothetical protein
MVSLVGATLAVTAGFLIYYSLYGLLLLLSSDCPKGMKAKAGLSIGVALLLAVGLLVGARKVGEAWDKVEEEFAQSPMYSTDRFAHAEESRYWAQRAMTTTVAAAILFPLVFAWMKAGTLAPLESKCKLQKGTFWAQARDSLKSLEFLVYGVALMLAVTLYSAVKNWRAFRSLDKAQEHAEKEQQRRERLEVARQQRLERYGQGGAGGFQHEEGGVTRESSYGDESPGSVLHRAFKEYAPVTAASGALAWQGVRATGRGIRATGQGISAAAQWARGKHPEPPVLSGPVELTPTVEVGPAKYAPPGAHLPGVGLPHQAAVPILSRGSTSPRIHTSGTLATSTSSALTSSASTSSASARSASAGSASARSASAGSASSSSSRGLSSSAGPANMARKPRAGFPIAGARRGPSPLRRPRLRGLNELRKNKSRKR